MRRLRSAQAVHLGLEGIEDDAIVLGGGERRAVVEVGSLNFALQGDGTARRPSPGSPPSSMA